MPPVEPAAGLSWQLLVLVLVAVALTALVLLGAWLLSRHRRRPHAGGAGNLPGRRRDGLAGLLEETVDDLRREPDPRRAIVAAYARMERTLLPKGLGRRRAETPMEYLERVLAQLALDPGPPRRLTSLFGRAKFSHHPIGETMRAQAIDALTASASPSPNGTTTSPSKPPSQSCVLSSAEPTEPTCSVTAHCGTARGISRAEAAVGPEAARPRPAEQAGQRAGSRLLHLAGRHVQQGEVGVGGQQRPGGGHAALPGALDQPDQHAHDAAHGSARSMTHSPRSRPAAQPEH